MITMPCRLSLGATTLLVLALYSCGGASRFVHTTATDASSADDNPAAGCNGDTPEETRSRALSPGPDGAGMANPADKHCVESGYRLEYVRQDGISVDGLCVNDETGAKCTAWAYFRGECALESDIE